MFGDLTGAKIILMQHDFEIIKSTDYGILIISHCVLHELTPRGLWILTLTNHFSHLYYARYII